MTVNVRPFGPNDALAWDAFVRGAEEGTFFHLSAWQTIFQKSFNLAPHYLIAEQNQAITGVLPLFHQKSLLFGNALISSPYLVQGGPLARSEESRLALDMAAADLKKETGASYIEFRSRSATRPNWASKRAFTQHLNGRSRQKMTKTCSPYPENSGLSCAKQWAVAKAASWSIARRACFQFMRKASATWGLPYFHENISSLS